MKEIVVVVVWGILEIADVQFFSIDEIIKMKNQLRADGFYLNSLQKK